MQNVKFPPGWFLIQSARTLSRNGDMGTERIDNCPKLHWFTGVHADSERVSAGVRFCVKT